MKKTLKKILYIEDEEDIRSIAQISLEDLGAFKVLCCRSGQEAIDLAEDYNPDLILLDVMMPNLDGPSTLKLLKQINSLKDTPTIFMTAKILNTEMADYKKLGAIGVIAKPFDPMTLPQQILLLWESYHA